MHSFTTPIGSIINKDALKGLTTDLPSFFTTELA